MDRTNLSREAMFGIYFGGSAFFYTKVTELIHVSGKVYNDPRSFPFRKLLAS